jgi:hypothetical protein
MKGRNRDISGGLLAFAISTSLSLVTDFLASGSSSLPIKLFEGFFIYFVATMIASFVTLQEERKDERTQPIRIAITASIFTLGLMLLIGTISGLLWILLAYNIGALFGGYLSERYGTRVKLTELTDTKEST